MKQTEIEKYVGLVKWFHDQAKNANYGFIQHAILGDLFFHEKSIEQGQDTTSFKENEVVVFISQASKKHEGKLEAIQVKILSTETDLNFLFNHFLSILTEKGKYSDYNHIQKAVHSRIQSLLEKTEDVKINDELFNKFQSFVSNQLQTPLIQDTVFLKGLFNVCKNFFLEKYSAISKIVEHKINSETAHSLWLENYVENCQVDYIASIILTAEPTIKSLIFAKCNIEDKTNILNKILERFNHINTNEELEQILEVINLSKKYTSEIEKIVFNKIQNIIDVSVKNIVDVDLLHRFWVEKFSSVCQISFIASFIINTDDKTRKYIFELCTPEDKINIFFKVVSDLENGVIEFSIEIIKAVLKFAKIFAIDQHDKILNETLRICPPYYKLSLWLEDYHQSLQFEEYKLYTITLNPTDQKKFVKKVLKYIHEEKVKISVEELTSINIIDYETSKLAENIDNSKLDYSTSIILNTISELNSQTQIETRKQEKEAKFRIFDLILNQIREPNDILEIKGYFDECEGRCSVSINETKDEAGIVVDKEIIFNRNEHKKAKLHPICDGRKFLKDGIPVLDETNNIEFWWCANQKCYKPSREIHNSEQWEKYTLLDFLKILKIGFREKDFEIYLSIINKANRFLKHLNCRECKHILRPVRQSNYAFYGVNNFNCTNDNCKEKGKEIYLTHCLNGKCEQEIDSRDSVKCKPDGVDSEKCGWYVCNYCLSCCSDDVINARISNLKSRGQEYQCHTNGHRNLGVISCNKCGNAMESNEIDNEKFQKTLNWLISNKENSKHILKSGVTKNNKNWFRFAKADLSAEEYNSKLHSLLSLGFQIPNIDENRDIQLISEPNDFKKHNSEILTCKVCDNILDLSNDLERAATVKTFHNVRYVKQTRQI